MLAVSPPEPQAHGSHRAELILSCRYMNDPAFLAKIGEKMGDVEELAGSGAGAAAPSEPAGARDGSGGRLRTSSRGATAAPPAAAPAPATPPEWLAKAQQVMP